MIKAKLSPHLESDEYYYFFSMLSDRFTPLNDLWAKGLEKRFGKPFKPIYVLPFYHNSRFEEENYIVLNEWLEDIWKQTKRTDIFCLIFPEDVNRQFSKSPEIHKLSQTLIAKQGQVFVLSFSSTWFDLEDPNIILLGPDPAIASRYDAKIKHYQTFEKLGMETIPTTVHQDMRHLRDNPGEFPFFISAMYSSGGIESKAIFSADELDAYYEDLRPINKSKPFIVSPYIDDIVLAPNSTGIVTGEDTAIVVCISDQILRKNQYMGNVYPSQASKDYVEQMHTMTLAVGKHLAQEGFRGLFGLDFLITRSGTCYPVDLNPRRQGGYFCSAMSSPVNLIDLELAVIFGEPVPKYSYDDFHVDYCWAHSKLAPYHPNMKIIDDFCEGDPSKPFRDIGSTFKALYYAKDQTILVGNPGFYLTSGTSYQEVQTRLSREVEEIISNSYERTTE